MFTPPALLPIRSLPATSPLKSLGVLISMLIRVNFVKSFLIVVHPNSGVRVNFQLAWS